MTLDAADLEALSEAVETLENPGLAMQITNLIGKPIEYGVKQLPAMISGRIDEASGAALRAALRFAVSSMRGKPDAKPSNRAHRLLATMSGAVGGAFGLPALAVELPVSTTIMLRSMADIARGEGEDIRSIETQLACLEVFAIGSESPEDDSAETSYYATRAALARAVSGAAKYIAKKGLADEAAPAILRLVTKVAARFSIPVTEKFVAQSVPALGAAGGAAINLIFVNHFQEMARGHFTIRRLERKYGADVIEQEYRRISRQSS